MALARVESSMAPLRFTPSFTLIAAYHLALIVTTLSIAPGQRALAAQPSEHEPAPTRHANESDEPFDLTPTFTLGVPLRYEHFLTMTQKQKYREFGEDVVSLQMISNLRFIPTRRLENGGAEVEMSFDRLSIDIVPAVAPRFQYDSETDHDRSNQERYVRAIRRITESVLIFELSASGRVEHIIGADEIARLVQGLSGYEVLGAVLSKNWLIEVAGDVFMASAGHTTRPVGETWSEQLALTLGGYPNAEIRVKWKFDDVADGTAIFGGVGDVTPPVRADPRLRGATQNVAGTFSRFSKVWSLAKGRATLVEKSQAMNLEYASEDFVIGNSSLGTHELLRSLDP